MLGSDLNAPTWAVRPLLEDTFNDTLDWGEQLTWPVNADEWVQVWKQKLGEKPNRDSEPRRLDYLLYRGVEVVASGAIALADTSGSASDHRLVWADIEAAANNF